jgi:hypothetical protein
MIILYDNCRLSPKYKVFVGKRDWNGRRMRRRPSRGDDITETDLKYVASERIVGFELSQVQPGGTQLLRRCGRCTNCSVKGGNFLGTGL